MKIVIDIDDKTYKMIKDEIYFISGRRGSARVMEYNALKAIYDGKPLEQEPCEDCISRQAAKRALEDRYIELQKRHDDKRYETNYCLNTILELPSVNPQKIGHCKDCKYFEYDSLAKVDGVKLIFAHEICKRWGDGCKTSEEGFCFLFEPQESEDKECK